MEQKNFRQWADALGDRDLAFKLKIKERKAKTYRLGERCPPPRVMLVLEEMGISLPSVYRNLKTVAQSEIGN